MSQISASLTRKIRRVIRDDKHRFAVGEALAIFADIILSVATEHRGKKDIDEAEKGRAALIFLDLHSVLSATAEQISSVQTGPPPIPSKTLHLSHLS